MHIESALKSGYKYNFQFAGENRKEESFGIQNKFIVCTLSVWVHYIPCWPTAQHVFKKQKVRTPSLLMIFRGRHTRCELL